MDGYIQYLTILFGYFIKLSSDKRREAVLILVLNVFVDRENDTVIRGWFTILGQSFTSCYPLVQIVSLSQANNSRFLGEKPGNPGLESGVNEVGSSNPGKTCAVSHPCIEFM